MKHTCDERECKRIAWENDFALIPANLALDTLITNPVDRLVLAMLARFAHTSTGAWATTFCMSHFATLMFMSERQILYSIKRLEDAEYISLAYGKCNCTNREMNKITATLIPKRMRGE